MTWSWPKNPYAYHLIKLYDEGVVGHSAVAIPYYRLDVPGKSSPKITRPESGHILSYDEREASCVLVKCWEIGGSLQYLSIVKDLLTLYTLNAPPTFVLYTDVFWNCNATNNGMQVFCVRPFFEHGTLWDHLQWMGTRGTPYSTVLLDRWLIQLLTTIDWAHTNQLTLVNLSLKNICLTDDGMDLRIVDFLPPGIVKEILHGLSSPMKCPKDDHVLTLFKPEKWTFINDFDAAAYVLLQLSLVGHNDYPRVKLLAHPYCVREHWSELMTAVSEVHGTPWMLTLDRLMGEQHAEQREEFAKELTTRIKYELQHPMLNVEVWDSGTNVTSDNEDADKCATEPVQLQHNQPESSVLVSFLEQAFEFFQHDSQDKPWKFKFMPRNEGYEIGDFARICHSMLKLVPTDQQAAFNSHHLVMFAEMFDKQTDSDRGVVHSLATVLAGLLYADDVDKLACAGNFGPKLVRFLDKHLQAPDLLCMLATALSQIPLDVSRNGCLTQQLVDLPALFRCAFTHFWEWPTLMPLVMCILQAVSTMPMTDVARTPLVPLLMLTIHCHVNFPCEINLALRMLRRLIQKSDLGACMVIRFPVGGALYSPVDTFLRILELHGNKNSIRREIALITVRLWSIERFFPILIQDGWLKIFATLTTSSRQQQGIMTLLKQCLADRDLVIIDNKVHRISKEPFITSDEHFEP